MQGLICITYLFKHSHKILLKIKRLMRGQRACPLLLKSVRHFFTLNSFWHLYWLAVVFHNVVDEYTLEGTEQLFRLQRNHYLWVPRPCKICLSFLLYNLLLVDSCQAGPSPNTSHTALDTLESNDSSTHSCPSLDLPKGRNCVLFICKLQREACSPE